MIDSNFKIAVGTKVVDTIQAELDRSPKKTVKVTPILDDSGMVNGYKSLETYHTKGGEVVKINRELDKSGKDMGATLNSVAETNKKVGKSFYETTRHVDTLGSKFLDITKKVIAFGGVTAIIGLFTKTISESYQAVKNMDDVMTEFNKVSDMSGESLSRYTDELTEMGESVARTGAEMLASSTEFVKAGYDEKQSAELAKVANLYMNIADGQLTSADASSIVIAGMKAFNMTAEESVQIIDVINEVNKLAFLFGNI